MRSQADSFQTQTSAWIDRNIFRDEFITTFETRSAEVEAEVGTVPEWIEQPLHPEPSYVSCLPCSPHAILEPPTCHRSWTDDPQCS